MNIESLNELWNSSANRPAPDAGQRMASHFVSSLRRRRRFRAFWLAWTSFLLTGASILAVTHLVRNGLEKMDAQWALFPLMALPWITLAYFWRAFLRHGAVSGASALPLRAALVAAQTANTAERHHLRLVGWLFAAMVPFTALAIWQLHAAGKTPGNQVWSMAVAFGVIFIMGALGLRARHRRQLLPEQLTIEARLRELDHS
ncbi:hypothetical protein DB347_06715 [Opitutaceae bacterium EW11]|nr:hypothetical protein DB347_06715 [Opitutaceae bacterium EW11]